MNFLSKIEKNKIVWCIIVFSLLFFFLRLPSIIEPYWYGDEGVYEVIGQAMDHGRLLYRDIWDNKPPLLYVVYALAQGDQPTVKIFSIIAGLLSMITFFFLSQKLFNKSRVSIPITILYIFLLGTPILEGNIANAEDFIILPVILAGLLIYNLSGLPYKNIVKGSSISNPKSLLFSSGILLGIAFLFKIVVIFDFATFLIFFNLMKLPNNVSFSFHKKTRKNDVGIFNFELWKKTLIPSSLFIILGFLLPVAATALYFAFNNAFTTFFQATFSGNVSYVGFQNSFLGIPQGLLLLKFLLLLIALFAVLLKRANFTKPTLFIVLWLIFSLFNVFFSERAYTHYVIELVPSFCLFIGFFFISKTLKNRLQILAGFVVVVTLLLFQFQFNMPKSYAYYTNAINFLTGSENVENYQAFFDPHVPRDYAVVAFILKNTSPSDTIFIWGNNPQIYALSHKLPPGKYTVAYHILQNNAIIQTEQAINKTAPKYVIILKETQPLPFPLPLYIMRYNIPGATIYERSI